MGSFERCDIILWTPLISLNLYLYIYVYVWTTIQILAIVADNHDLSFECYYKLYEYK